MSNNVISITDRLATRRSNSDRDPRAAEAALRAAERMRLNKVRELYNSERLKKNDVVKVAQTLGVLLREARSNGHSTESMRSKWAQEGRNSKEGKDTFKIHRYSIKAGTDLGDPGILSAQKRRLSVKLLKPYVDRALFIAKEAGFDRDETEIRLFRNTEFWRGSTRSASKDDPLASDSAENVAFELQEMAGRVVRDTALAVLFARMRRVPGQWDIHTKRFRPSQSACLFGNAYQNWNEDWSEAPPLPSVALVRLCHANLPFPIRLSKKGIVTEVESDLTLPAVPPEDGEERHAKLHIYREIRLALGPTVERNAIGPLFESRVHAELAILDEEGQPECGGPLDFHSNWGLPTVGPTRSAAVRINDEWRPFTPSVDLEASEYDPAADAAAIRGEHTESPFAWDQTPLADEKKCFGNWWLSWTPVDAPHFAHWFDHPSGRPSEPVEFLPEALEPRPATETWFPRGRLAHLVELALYDRRLAAALRSEIAVIREAFESHEREWRERMQEQTAEIVAEFNSDLAAKALQEQPTGDDSEHKPRV
jgi:hypothetical protein